MRVLQVYKNYYPTLGGIENHIRLLAKGLRSQEGIEVSVLVANSGPRTVREIVDGVPVIRAGSLFVAASAPLSPFLPFELAQFTRRDSASRDHAADLLHLHFPYPVGELAYLLAGRSCPLVLTYHSDIVRQRRLLPLYAPFLRRLLTAANRIIVSSPGYAASSPYLGHFLDKCTVIPLAVDLERFVPHPRALALAAAIRATYPPPIVLFVGKLRYYKGVDYLIRAMRDVPASLLIIGTGPLDKELRILAARDGLAGRVKFLGDVSDDELPASYYASDVFVLPSTERSEAFGMVLLEAMACGIPVISTELGTGTSYVNRDGETGLVVPPHDSTAIADALRRLLENEEWRKHLGHQARERVHREFSPQTMVAKVAEVYRQVLGRY